MSENDQTVWCQCGRAVHEPESCDPVEDDESMNFEDLTRRPNRQKKNRRKVERFSDDD